MVSFKIPDLTMKANNYNHFLEEKLASKFFVCKKKSVALVVGESKNLQESCKAILQVNAYRYQDSCKILASFSSHLQESFKLIDSSCTILASFSIQMLGKGGQRRKGADLCSSKLVLAFAWAFLTSLTTTDGALLCSKRSAPWPSRQRKKQRP